MLLVSLLPGGVRAQSGSEPRAESAAASAQSASAEGFAGKQAIERGLRFLYGEQEKQSSGAMSSRYPVAVTALGGLAIIGAGHRYRAGPGERAALALEKALAFLEQTMDENIEKGLDGYISDAQSKMHGHSYAVLFLTQIYGELPAARQERVALMIRKGLLVIQKSQTAMGGWWYTPDRKGVQDENSITICVLQALRAANGTGFVVPKSVVDAAVDYVKSCQERDGSFRYSLRGPDLHSSYALTVAAISTLHAAGVYDAPEIGRGMDYVRKRISKRPGEPFLAAEREFISYANLYAAQAFYQVGGDAWAQFYPGIRRHLLERQSEDGSFEDDYGREFGTAVAVLILEVPLNYLPLFQR